MTRVIKSNKGWREWSQKLMSLSPIFSMPILSQTEFSIVRKAHESTSNRLSKCLLQLCYQIKSNILPTWLVSACVSMCKSECQNS